VPSIRENIAAIRRTLPEGVTLVCVSKFQPIEAIQEAYDAGERDFGESRVQELCAKYQALPKDIRWHFIGHLQTNKVRDIVPFVHLIQSVDSVHLLETIDREAARIHRPVNVLLEVHTAKETTKTGFSPEDLSPLNCSEASSKLSPFTQIIGLMTMATNTDNESEIRRCFRTLARLSSLTLNQSLPFEGRLGGVLSMGMSDDYPIAIEEGSTMVRIGSAIFGKRIVNLVPLFDTGGIEAEGDEKE